MDLVTKKNHTDTTATVENFSLTAEEFNQLPAELEYVITQAGLTPSASDLTQVYRAITELITANSPDLLDGSPKWGSDNTILFPENMRVKVSDKKTYLKVPSGGLTLDITTTGKNGLDTGTPADGVWYYLYLIYKPTVTTEVATLASIEPENPTLPTGFTVKAPLGIAVIRITGGLRQFVINEKERHLYWIPSSGAGNTSLAVFNTTAPTTYTQINSTMLLPPTAVNARICARNTGGAADNFYVRPKGMVGNFPPSCSMTFDHNWFMLPFIDEAIIEVKSDGAIGTRAVDILGYGF